MPVGKLSKNTRNSNNNERNKKFEKLFFHKNNYKDLPSKNPYVRNVGSTRAYVDYFTTKLSGADILKKCDIKAIKLEDFKLSKTKNKKHKLGKLKNPKLTSLVKQ